MKNGITRLVNARPPVRRGFSQIPLELGAALSKPSLVPSPGVPVLGVNPLKLVGLSVTPAANSPAVPVRLIRRFPKHTITFLLMFSSRSHTGDECSPRLKRVFFNDFYHSREKYWRWEQDLSLTYPTPPANRIRTGIHVNILDSTPGPNVNVDAYCAAAGMRRIALLKVAGKGREQECRAVGLLRRRIDLLQSEYGQQYREAGTTLEEVVTFLRDHGFGIFRLGRSDVEYVSPSSAIHEDFQTSHFVAVASRFWDSKSRRMQSSICSGSSGCFASLRAA